MASALHWVPESLYNLSMSCVVSKLNHQTSDIRSLPSRILFDIYYQIYKEGKLCLLGLELAEIDTFEKVLKVTDKRHLLHHCFQAVMDHGSKLANILADNFSQYCCMQHCATHSHKDKAINLGLSLGLFLSDAGWFKESERVLHACLQLCKTILESEFLIKSLDCCLRLLHVRINYCMFNEAEKALVESQLIVKKLESEGLQFNLAGFYSEFSLYYYNYSKFDKSYEYAVLALKQLNGNLPIKTIIDVIRQASRACISVRKFSEAELLIKHAYKFTVDEFGPKHPTTSIVLSDFGFYFLNVDDFSQSVHMYQAALNIRQSAFGGQNLLLAMSHEDLAYATYVNEYSIGYYINSQELSNKAVDIMENLLPSDHFLLASCRRVKALILEERSIVTSNFRISKKLLEDAEELHLSALMLTRNTFGEMNVLTAKHYGNLGRLYQSMRKFNKAEEMHLTAISIKEELLGPDDYEVALSIGHLASLYAFDLKLYDKAEKLYLRSIQIGKQLFGNSYSGLQYDYRGLLRVYTATAQPEKIATYSVFLDQWKLLREEQANKSPTLNVDIQVLSIHNLIEKFL